MKDTIHFDAPEFYGQDDVVLTADGPQGRFYIVSEGDRSVHYTVVHESDEASVSNTYHLYTARQFRDMFPDGNMPEASDNFAWDNNGWFAVYMDNDDEVEVMGEPMMSLAEAATYALELAYGEL